MLQPRVQKVSSKGQVVIPADLRRCFGIEDSTEVMIIPFIEEKKIVIKLTPQDPIKEACGVLSAWKKPATQIMKEIRKEEEQFEKKKFKKLHLR